MKTLLTAGTALAALAVTAGGLASHANAADLGGSIKDGYVSPMPEIVRSAAGPCYFRGDLGYSWARSPEIKWPVSNDTIHIIDDGNGGYHETYRESHFVTDEVSNTSRENGIFGEVGAGCGSGSRGLRGEVMFGIRGNRKVDGEPGNYTIDYVEDTPVTTPPTDPVDPVDDPLHTSVKSYTLMFNAYKDLGRYGNITPYVGGGVGVAYHKVDETYFTGNYNLVNRIEGDSDIAFAWSLMAGIGYQLTDRAILDIGYRYIDMGDANGGRVDSAGFVNPRVEIDDLAAHEIKIGLRYHFGGAEAVQYAPMK